MRKSKSRSPSALCNRSSDTSDLISFMDTGSQTDNVDKSSENPSVSTVTIRVSGSDRKRKQDQPVVLLDKMDAEESPSKVAKKTSLTLAAEDVEQRGTPPRLIIEEETPKEQKSVSSCSSNEGAMQTKKKSILTRYQTEEDDRNRDSGYISPPASSTHSTEQPSGFEPSMISPASICSLPAQISDLQENWEASKFVNKVTPITPTGDVNEKKNVQQDSPLNLTTSNSLQILPNVQQQKPVDHATVQHAFSPTHERARHLTIPTTLARPAALNSLTIRHRQTAIAPAPELAGDIQMNRERLITEAPKKSPGNDVEIIVDSEPESVPVTQRQLQPQTRPLNMYQFQHQVSPNQQQRMYLTNNAPLAAPRQQNTNTYTTTVPPPLLDMIKSDAQLQQAMMQKRLTAVPNTTKVRQYSSLELQQQQQQQRTAEIEAFYQRRLAAANAARWRMAATQYSGAPPPQQYSPTEMAEMFGPAQPRYPMPPYPVEFVNPQVTPLNGSYGTIPATHRQQFAMPPTRVATTHPMTDVPTAYMDMQHQPNQDVRYTIQQRLQQNSQQQQQPAFVKKPVPAKQAEKNTGHCSNCTKKAQFLCSGCRQVWYCSQTCQIAGWPAHKALCPLR